MNENWWMCKKREETNYEKLKRLAEVHQGKVVVDSQYGSVVHVSPFHCVTKDGVHIYEWP